MSKYIKSGYIFFTKNYQISSSSLEIGISKCSRLFLKAFISALFPFNVYWSPIIVNIVYDIVHFKIYFIGERVCTFLRTRRFISTSPTAPAGVSPIITAFPPSLTLLKHWKNVCGFPKASTAISTPNPPVISCSKLGKN